MTAGFSRLWRPASLYLLHPCSRMLAMIRTATVLASHRDDPYLAARFWCSTLPEV